MPTIDPIHGQRIATAIDQVNQAVAAGLSPVADGFNLLDTIAELQADLRNILEAERRRGMMSVAN